MMSKYVSAIFSIFLLGQSSADEINDKDFSELVRKRIEEIKVSDPTGRIVFDEKLYDLLSKFAVLMPNVSHEKIESVLKLAIKTENEIDMSFSGDKVTCKANLPPISDQVEKNKFEQLSGILALRYGVDLKLNEMMPGQLEVLSLKYPKERASLIFSEWNCLLNNKKITDSSLQFNLNQFIESNVNPCDTKAVNDYIGPGHCGPGNCGPNDGACGPDNCSPNDAACGPDNHCGPSASSCGPDNCGPSDSGCGPDNCGPSH